MTPSYGKRAILIGAGLLVAGWLALFLTVIGLVKPSFVVSFLAYGACMVGLALGVFGAFLSRGRGAGE
jgi:hypothetical protein